MQLGSHQPEPVKQRVDPLGGRKRQDGGQRSCGGVQGTGSQMDAGQVDAGQRLAGEPVLLAGLGACLVGRDGVLELIDGFPIGPVDIGEYGTDVAHVAGQRDRELTADLQHVVGVIPLARIAAAGKSAVGAVGIAELRGCRRVPDVQVSPVRPFIEIAQAVLGEVPGLARSRGSCGIQPACG